MRKNVIFYKNTEHTDADWTYTISNPDVIEIVDGKVVAKSIGKTTITAKPSWKGVTSDDFVNTITLNVKEFDKQNILHIRTGLPSADYMAVRYNEEKGFYLDYSVLIDTKKDIEEIAGNLCNSQSHQRIKNEIARGKELGVKDFIFLINGSKTDWLIIM